MHHLDFEKIIDKLGSKYEAVIRMSAIARKMSDDGVTEESTGGKKITTAALGQYCDENLIKQQAEAKE
jgi:DNA-directed RNA polymerase subunit K/omega